MITKRQRLIQEKKIKNAIDLLELEKKIKNAIDLLELARKEIRTATPIEVSETVEVALEIINGINKFLTSRGT